MMASSRQVAVIFMVLNSLFINSDSVFVPFSAAVTAPQSECPIISKKGVLRISMPKSIDPSQVTS